MNDLSGISRCSVEYLTGRAGSASSTSSSHFVGINVWMSAVDV